MQQKRQGVPTLMIVAAECDSVAARELIQALEPLVQEELLIVWHDDNLELGCDWDQAIPQRARSADMIAILCSQRALEGEQFYYNDLLAIIRERKARHDGVLAVPVFLDRCTPFGFGTIVGTPREGSVYESESRQRAWAEVVHAFRRIVCPPEPLPMPPGYEAFD